MKHLSDRPQAERQETAIRLLLDQGVTDPVVLLEATNKVPLFENPSFLLREPEIPLFKPFAWPSAYPAFILQNKTMWIPEEQDMGNDVRQWNSVVSETDKFIIISILRFFVQGDVSVGGAYLNTYLKCFHHVDIRMMLSAFMNIESIHVAAYAHLIDSIGLPESEYSVFMQYKEMSDKFNYYESFKVGSVRDLIMSMAVFSAFTEGMQLYSSFAILFNPSRKGLLMGMAQIIRWSIRDESLHANTVLKLLGALISENPHLWDNEAKNRVKDIAKVMVHHEDVFIDLAFSQGEPDGLTGAELKGYVRYLCDRRCNQMGMSPIYNIEKNPLPWMDDILSVEHTNIFEATSTDYSKVNSTGTWDDAFADSDVDEASLNNLADLDV